MMLPGDMIETALKPIVKGTKFEGCEGCKRRKNAINKFFTKLIAWFKGLSKRK